MNIPVSGEVVIDVIESMLADRRALPLENCWLTAGVPALRKGDALIVPLAWARDAEPAERAAVREKASALRSDVDGALEHRWIFLNGIDLEKPRAIDSPTYAAELLRTGARDAYWAGPGHSPRMIVCVTYGAPLPAPVDAVAVHVIPSEWIDGEMPPTDLNWAWDEVTELAATKSYDDVDPPGPFHRTTYSRGALLPSDARDLIVQHHGLPPGATAAAEDGWLAENVPVLVRGDAKIIPLTWQGYPDRGWNPYADDDDMRAFVSRVRESIIDAAGPARSVDLADTLDPVDSTGSYRQALRKSRVDRAEWWTLADGTAIALVWTRGFVSVAVHVIPAGWVDETLSTEPVPDIDLSWSWKQVIELDDLLSDWTDRQSTGRGPARS